MFLHILLRELGADGEDADRQDNSGDLERYGVADGVARRIIDSIAGPAPCAGIE